MVCPNYAKIYVAFTRTIAPWVDGRRSAEKVEGTPPLLPLPPFPSRPLRSRPLKSSYGVWVSNVSSPSRVWGRASPSRNWIWCIL